MVELLVYNELGEHLGYCIKIDALLIFLDVHLQKITNCKIKRIREYVFLSHCKIQTKDGFCTVDCLYTFYLMKCLKQTQIRNQFDYICNKIKQDTKEMKFDRSLRCQYENRSVSRIHVSSRRDSQNANEFVKS